MAGHIFSCNVSKNQGCAGGGVAISPELRVVRLLSFCSAHPLLHSSNTIGQNLGVGWAQRHQV